MEENKNINNSNLNAYKNAVSTVDGITKVIMLYDTAIASIQQAKQAIINKNIEERFNKIARAYQILIGLRDSLDFEVGSEVAVTLRDWYSQTSLRVLKINRTEDLELCDSCVKHIKEMREAWVVAERTVRSPSSDESDVPPKAANSSSNNSDFFETIAKSAVSMNISV